MTCDQPHPPQKKFFFLVLVPPYALVKRFDVSRCRIFYRPGGCSTNTFVTYSWIHSVDDHIASDLQNIITSKPLELESWYFERMFTPHHVSLVTCNLSLVTCHLSALTCHKSPLTRYMSPLPCHIFFLHFFSFYKKKKKKKAFTFLNKDPAYGRQIISRPMQIVTPMP